MSLYHCLSLISRTGRPGEADRTSTTEDVST